MLGRPSAQRQVRDRHQELKRVESLKIAMPNIPHVSCGNAVLLSGSIGDETVVDIVFNCKLTTFRLLIASRHDNVERTRCVFL